MKISSVILTTKKSSQKASVLAQKVRKWLEERGIVVRLSQGLPEDLKPEPGKPSPDLVMVLGGDGTILSRARNLLDLEIPFLGINLGQVGFMAEISPDLWQDQLAGIIAGDMIVSRRMVLSYILTRNERTIEQGRAINEIVINRGELARLINLKLDLPGGVSHEIRADGVIFSTPTGSTAYSVSAGGPLVHPDLKLLIITPICPFPDDFKSLVLPSTEKVFAGIAKSDAEAFLTVDGQLGFRLRPGDIIEVSRYPRDFKVLCVPEQGFISKLVAKRFLKRR